MLKNTKFLKSIIIIGLKSNEYLIAAIFLIYINNQFFLVNLGSSNPKNSYIYFLVSTVSYLTSLLQSVSLMRVSNYS